MVKRDMYKTLLVVLTIALTAWAQTSSTTSCPEGQYCYIVDGSVYAILNLTRGSCTSDWEYELLSPLEDGNYFIIGSGSIPSYYWSYSNTFGAGTGFVVYFQVTGMEIHHSGATLTFQQSTITIPRLRLEPYEGGPYTVTESDPCGFIQQKSLACSVALNVDYDFSNNPSSFDNVIDYSPENPIHPVIQDGCVYLLNEAEAYVPLHQAPLFCYLPSLNACTVFNEMAISSVSGLVFELPIAYGPPSSTCLALSGDMSVCLDVSNAWLEHPTLEVATFSGGFTLVVGLYNSEGELSSTSTANWYNFPPCGSSSCSAHHNNHGTTTSFFTSFSSWSSSSWSSSSWSSSSWSSSSGSSGSSSSGHHHSSEKKSSKHAHSSDEESDDALSTSIILAIAGAGFMLVAGVVVVVIVALVYLNKKRPYQPMVAMDPFYSPDSQ